MKHFRHIVIALLFAIICAEPVLAQKECEVPHKAFKDGESLTYKVYYNWGQLWVGAGEVSFDVKLEDFRGRPTYHFTSKGKTYKAYDWFFKVRDVYQAYSDTSTLRPHYFKRDVSEGDYYFRKEYVFNHKRKKAYAVAKTLDQAVRKDTIDLPRCTYDVLSIIYFARCIDFSKYKPQDTIPITIMLDQKIENIYIRYLGKGTHQTDRLGKFRCIKFSPLLVSGSIFKEGDEMVVWVTDDENQVPIYVESPIIVGTIKAKIKSMKNLKHKVTSKID